MKVIASALALSAGLVSLLDVAWARSVHENNARSHTKRSHDLMKRSFSGQATYFIDGQGACGNFNKPSDYIVAVNSPQYDGGSHCGQTLTITGLGKTMTATAEDECPGCDYGSLDMSQGLFTYFAPTSVGEFPITWVWGSGDVETTTTTEEEKTTTTHTTTSTTSTRTSTSTTPTTTSVASTTSSSSSLSSSSIASKTSTSSTSAAPTDNATTESTTSDPSSDPTGSGNNIANQQMLVSSLGNIAAFGRSNSS